MNAAATASGRTIATRRRLAVFASLLRRRGDFGVQDYAAVFFIGVGDLLDDDRRLVRGDTFLTGPPTSPASPDAPRLA